MKTEEILEGNVLLAEFMGCANQLHLIEHPKTGEYCDPEFHSSWDWLMPVVEKIEEAFDGDTCVTISDESCLVVSGRIFSRYVADESKIEAVFQACVEFAKWYKNQPK